MHNTAPDQLLAVPPPALPGLLQHGLLFWRSPGYVFEQPAPAHLGGDETPSQEPSGLKTRLSKRTRRRTRRRARGKGSRRWWNWAKSGLSSKSDQVMFGGSQIEGDQNVAARDAITYLAPAISTLLHSFSMVTGY